MEILTRVTLVDAGLRLSALITSQGEAYLWGANTSGQLGKGDEDDSHTPTRPESTAELADRCCLHISYGGTHTLMLMGAKGAPPPTISAKAPVPAATKAAERKPAVAGEEPAAPAPAAKKRKQLDDDGRAGPSPAAQADGAVPPPVKKPKVRQ